MLAPPGGKQAVRRPPPAFEPLDPRLIARPLDFLLAERYRLRAALTQLDWLARGGAGEARRKLAQALARYFGEDFALHLADESDDFYPLLRQRCADDTAFIVALDAVALAQREREAQCRALLGGLEVLVEAPQRLEASPEFAAGARAFVEAERRRIALANAVLMPAARARLEAADLRRLAHKLAARRGLSRAAIARPPEPPLDRADG